MREPDVKFVVAGTKAEFDEFCKRKMREIAAEINAATTQNINDVLYERKFIYVESVHMLRGLSEVHGWFTGTYRYRSDIEQIKERIKIINAWNSRPSLYDTYVQNMDSYKSISDMFRGIEAHNNMVFEAMYNNLSS